MDDTWRVKCSSTWTSTFPPLPPPYSSPAIAPASLSSSSTNQMNTTPQQFVFPFVTQGTNLENCPAPQEPLVFCTLNLDFANSGKNDLTSSFLALLSTNPNNLPGEFSPLAKLHATSGGVSVSTGNSASQITSIPSFQNCASGHLWNATIPSFDESRSYLISKTTNSLTSNSILQSPNANGRPLNNGQHLPFTNQMNQTPQGMTAKTVPVVPSHNLTRPGGRPRVTCMTTVGELFLSELGLLGVTCACHNIPMSMAKFCEHAGSLANVGDAVRLESGMTIAQWRKLCFGNNAPDDGKGWDWSDISSSRNGFIKSKAMLPCNPNNANSVQASTGLTKSSDEEYRANHLVTNCENSRGKFGTKPLLYLHPNAKSSISRNNFASEEHKVARNGHSSSIDLRLGQPSQVHTSLTSLLTPINSVQFKPQTNLPLSEKSLTANYPMEPKEPRTNFWSTSFEPSIRDWGQSQNAIEIDSNVTKNSLNSSLFHSHLKSEGSSASQLTNIVNNSKRSLLDSVSTINSVDATVLFNKAGMEKRPRLFENGGHYKQKTDTKVPTQATGEQCVHSGYSMQDSSQLYMNFNEYGNIPFGNFVTNNTVNPASLNLGKPTIPSSSNSLLVSEIAYAPTHAKRKNNGQQLIDERMKFLALRHQGACCHSGIDLHKNLCKGGLEALKKSRQGNFCDIQQNMSKLVGLSVQSCSTYLCGQSELCKCRVLTPSTSVCSKEQKSSTCLVCYNNGLPCLRIGKQIFDKKEQTTPFYGKCCCSVLAKHLTNCCLSKDFCPSNSLNEQNICKNANINHIPQICNEIHKFHDTKCGELCECTNKQVSTINDGQPRLWIDVPAKKTGNTDAASLKSSIRKGGHTTQEFDSKNEEQMSNVYSGSSAHALTEISVEVNKENCSTNDENNKNSYEFVADEGSVVEKCGSSDEAAVISKHEETNAVNTNQENKKKRKERGQMETSFCLINSESSHCVDHLKFKLSSPDESKSSSQASVKQRVGFKRKISSLTQALLLKTSNKLQPVKNDGQSLKTLPDSFEKEEKFPMQEGNCLDYVKPRKYISLNCIPKSDRNEEETADMKGKPVVCGKYGGLSGQKKPAKIVSLSSVLKRAKKCDANEFGPIRKELSASKARKMLIEESNRNCIALSCEKEGYIIENKVDCGNIREESYLHHESKHSQASSRYKEVHICSLSNVAEKNQHPTVRNDFLADGGSRKTYLTDEGHDEEPSQIGITRKGNSDAYCCVCGRANKEEFNCILECNDCLIRVHQACYGISKVPNGNWLCRPCKISSQNTVCVLCGYEGGAMTRAVKSQNIVKSLLKAWNLDSFMKSISSDGFVGTLEAFPEASQDLTSRNQTSELFLKKLQIYNSITAGLLDPSVTQWVHMVCGLWTPSTQCPNVATMSAFDVSGASPAKKSTSCSICKRTGGCCIKCRVPKCPWHFHPWCAYQKGLLQSEIEGEDNEKVGFYGRCMFHADKDGIHGYRHQGVPIVKSQKIKCARTEGYKGWKSEEESKPEYLRHAYSSRKGCIVSPEQINAWAHINALKSYRKTILKPPSDIEYANWDSYGNPRCSKKLDKSCIHLNQVQKEYLRYKQTKAWKALVVYKSGIHSLGLYTSQLISRGTMVVEYVGEIVGQKVADKREKEYESGKRLQYKSACYFFKIDKDQIIDATRKGGIARFVNHSCQPNCVAKIITVRNEKKVVFFAMRDINPGEEITYDYHFNREDEGEKIPCFCYSKNCRRYLN